MGRDTSAEVRGQDRVYCDSLDSTGNSIILQTFGNKNVLFLIPMWIGVFLMEVLWLFFS